MRRFYQVEEKPPFATSLILALQHMLAAFGAIIAVPLVVGGVLEFPPETMITIVNAALLVSGVVTIIQCKGLGPAGIRLPCVMGTSFTFVAVAIAIGKDYGMPGILGSALVGSLVMIIGCRFMGAVRKLFPPVVSGTVVLMIGVSLVPVGIDWLAGAQPGHADYGKLYNLLIGISVTALVVFLTYRGRGLLGAASIVVGIVVGYFICVVTGTVDFTPMASAQWFDLPKPLPFELVFPISGIITMSIAYLVTIMESTGDFIALSEASEEKLTGKRLSRGILCDGLGSALAAIFGTTPFSSFSQNIGIVAVTRVASRHVVALTGVLLIIAGLFPVLGALIVTVPSPVLGGASVVMFGMIIAAGVKMLARIEHSQRNGLIIAVSISAGLAVTTRPDLLNYLPDILQVVFSSGITTGALVAVLLNQLLPEKVREEVSTEAA